MKSYKNCLIIFLRYARCYFTSKFFIHNYSADDDINQLKEIKLIIEDLKAIRFAKINKNLDMASPDGLSLCLNNICARELEQIRPFVSEVYSYKLEMLNCNISNREDRFENMNPNNFQFN